MPREDPVPLPQDDGGPVSRDSSRVGRSRASRPYARILLPLPVSDRHAISVLVLGFAVEGATELYQFAERGNLGQGALAYYTTLATTILGFYLMFLGLREWFAFHSRHAAKPTAFSSPGRRWFGVGLWGGGTAAAALLALALGGGSADAAPFWIAWPVAGLVVLAFGDFFFGLRAQARRLGSSVGNALGWVAFIWSMGVATVAGLVVGDRVIVLLSEFVTNWAALIASIAPVVVAMSPLFVTYALLSGAFWSGLRPSRPVVRAPPPRSLPACPEASVYPT